MPQFYSNPTEYKNIDGKHTKVKDHPTIKLTNGDARLLAQGGEFWHLEGKLIPRNEWPKWAITELEKADDNYLKSAGFDFWWRKKEVKKEVQPSPRRKKYSKRMKPILEVVEDGNTSSVELVS